ncbi:hypothetical protein TCAL_06154 [Tigriopus californicus]|uniref:Uncharacterized protein n=1 Tax=Tigriopus californicus TaxID=6832 RepID=A0A553PL97_TIGCA|nr:hypothetical protein TCAL_06154 [Tigriopus californicus]
MATVNDSQPQRRQSPSSSALASLTASAQFGLDKDIPAGSTVMNIHMAPKTTTRGFINNDSNKSNYSQIPIVIVIMCLD